MQKVYTDYNRYTYTLTCILYVGLYVKWNVKKSTNKAAIRK